MCPELQPLTVEVESRWCAARWCLERWSWGSLICRVHPHLTGWAALPSENKPRHFFRAEKPSKDITRRLFLINRVKHSVLKVVCTVSMKNVLLYSPSSLSPATQLQYQTIFHPQAIPQIPVIDGLNRATVQLTRGEGNRGGVRYWCRHKTCSANNFPFMYFQKRFSQVLLLVSTNYFQKRIKWSIWNYDIL